MMTSYVPRIFFLTALTAIALGLVASTGCGVAKDTQIQVAIKNALQENRNIAYDKLTVNVKNGVATISGELGGQEDIDLVLEVASGIDGVVDVRNQMSIVDDWHSTNPTFNDYGMI